MHTIEANWEDEENNRRVAFSVDACRRGDQLEIRSLTPKRITFLSPDTKLAIRSMGVWTDRGRELLIEQLHKSGRLTDLEQQIESGLAV